MNKSITTIFKILSDPNRLRILKILHGQAMCLQDIKEKLNLASSTVSVHLKKLNECGFLIETKKGKYKEFRLNPAPEDQRISSIVSALDFWISIKEVKRKNEFYYSFKN